MTLRDGMVIVSMDPGRMTAFVVLEVNGHEIQVIAWGNVRISESISPEFDPQSILRNPWEARCTLEGPSCLSELLAMYSNKPHFVWEQQRGFLELCVGAPFVRHIKSSGKSIDKIPPNEKFNRLGVSKDKNQSVRYAAAFFEWISPELARELTIRPVDEVHDVADACLLAIMWLEERCGIPILGSQPSPSPSGCPVSKTLALTYAKVDVNRRKGANITRRIAITARIAASRATFLLTISEGSKPHRLTREFLRSLTMSFSEAADLCWFASWVISTLQPPFVGVAVDLEGLSFSMYKVKGNKKSAAAALAHGSLEAFKSIMVYQKVQNRSFITHSLPNQH